MQIINTIEIICAVCGNSMPVEMSVGREGDKYIYRVMPCSCSKIIPTEDGLPEPKSMTPEWCPF